MKEKLAALDLLEGYPTQDILCITTDVRAGLLSLSNIIFGVRVMKPLAGSLLDSWVFLTGELGIYYEDLYDLVKPLHEVNPPPYPSSCP